MIFLTAVQHFTVGWAQNFPTLLTEYVRSGLVDIMFQHLTEVKLLVIIKRFLQVY